jgi:hypothetical protein
MVRSARLQAYRYGAQIERLNNQPGGNAAPVIAAWREFLAQFGEDEDEVVRSYLLQARDRGRDHVRQGVTGET